MNNYKKLTPCDRTECTIYAYDNREALESLSVEDLLKVINENLADKLEFPVTFGQMEYLRKSFKWKKVKRKTINNDSLRKDYLALQRQYKELSGIVTRQGDRIIELENRFSEHIQSKNKIEVPRNEYTPVRPIVERRPMPSHQG